MCEVALQMPQLWGCDVQDVCGVETFRGVGFEGWRL
jgi:hypothetical protein